MKSRIIKPEGIVEVFTIDLDGIAKKIYEGKNTITYEGADVITNILSGNLTATINAVFMGFNSGGTAATTSTSVSTKASDFRALSSPLDYMRVRLSPGVLGASSVSYVNNKATFTGIAAAGETGEGGETFTGGTADVTHLGLAVAPDWDDATEDLLYAVHTPAAVIAVPTNSGVGVRWQTQFTAS